MSDDKDEPQPRRLTLAQLDARLALLEQPRPKTWRERFVAQGAVIALVISLLTGGYTLWDNFVVRPQSRLDAAYLDVQKQIQQIAAINLATSQQVAAARDRAAASYIDMQGLAQKMPLMAMILPVEPKVSERLSTADYFTLSNEILRSGDGARALQFADKAIARARSPYDTAFAKRNRAYLMFSMGRLDEARDAFEDAMRSASGPTLDYERANALIAWVGSELTNGDCSRVPALVTRFSEIIAQPSVYENTRGASTTQMRNMLLGQRRCPVPDAIVPADPNT